jgi:uncharacterized protein YjdB
MLDNGLITFPCTYTLTRDPALNYSVKPGFCGVGWQELLSDADTGFFPAATSINVEPATDTITVGSHRQLVAFDNNGNNRTNDCTWLSSNPARATVDGGGLVKGVATGAAATITATLGALTDTSLITVS